MCFNWNHNKNKAERPFGEINSSNCILLHIRARNEKILVKRAIVRFSLSSGLALTLGFSLVPFLRHVFYLIPNPFNPVTSHFVPMPKGLEQLISSIQFIVKMRCPTSVNVHILTKCPESLSKLMKSNFVSETEAMIINWIYGFCLEVLRPFTPGVKSMLSNDLIIGCQPHLDGSRPFPRSTKKHSLNLGKS